MLEGWKSNHGEVRQTQAWQWQEVTTSPGLEGPRGGGRAAAQDDGSPGRDWGPLRWFSHCWDTAWGREGGREKRDREWGRERNTKLNWKPDGRGAGRIVVCRNSTLSVKQSKRRMRNNPRAKRQLDQRKGTESRRKTKDEVGASPLKQKKKVLDAVQNLKFTK